MKTVRFLGIAILCLVLGFSTSSRAGWEVLGNTLDYESNQTPDYPSIYNDSGTLYVTWSESNAFPPGRNIYCKYYNGSNWQAIGAYINIDFTRTCREPDIAVSGGTPIVSWLEDNSGTFIYNLFVKQWDGDSWEQLGTPGTLSNYPSQSTQDHSIAYGGTTPFIAWSENTGPQYESYVDFYNGSDWQQEGSIMVNAQYPDLAFQGSTPFVAVRTLTGAFDQYSEITVRFYNGTDWEDYGNGLSQRQDDDDTEPDLTFDGTTPYVAWKEELSSYFQIYVKYYNGSDWELLGGSLNNNMGMHADNPHIAVINGTPFVSFTENNNIYTKFYNGSAWVQKGISVNNTSGTTYSGIVGRSNETHVVARDGSDLYVKIYLTPTPTNTCTPTNTATPTHTSTSTTTPTYTATPTHTSSATPSVTPTYSDTPTTTATPTVTATPTHSATASTTPTVTATPTSFISRTPTPTPTFTRTSTITVTSTITETGTLTTTVTETATKALNRYEQALAYPNPAREVAYFTFTENDVTEATVVIFNLAGERVAGVTETSPQGRLVWDLKGVAAGLYYYRLTVKSSGQEKVYAPKKIAIVK